MARSPNGVHSMVIGRRKKVSSAPASHALLAQLGDHAVLPDLVELVDRDQRRVVIGGREPERGQHADQEAAVVHADRRALETQRVDRGEGRPSNLASAEMPASPMMSMSHCTNWR